MEGDMQVRFFLVLIFSCLSCFCQRPGSLRSPATMMQYRPFTASEVLALSPLMWLDADQGVTPGTDGDKVSQWDDISGNNNHVKVTLAALQPYYFTNVINGHSALRWYATNLMTLTNRFATAPTNKMTFFVVFCSTNIMGGADASISGDIVGTVAPYRITWAGQRIGFGVSGLDSVSHTYTTNRWTAFCCQYQQTNASNSRIGIRQFDRQERWNDGAGVWVFRGTRLGYDVSTSDRELNGWIAEYIVINNLLNEYQIMGVMKYLLKKYNIPLWTLE